VQTPGLNHIILTVSNTERSRAFYSDLLAFAITVIEEDPDNIHLEYWLPGLPAGWYDGMTNTVRLALRQSVATLTALH